MGSSYPEEKRETTKNVNDEKEKKTAVKGIEDETNDELIESDEVLVIKRALDANLTF